MVLDAFEIAITTIAGAGILWLIALMVPEQMAHLNKIIHRSIVVFILRGDPATVQYTISNSVPELESLTLEEWWVKATKGMKIDPVSETHFKITSTEFDKVLFDVKFSRTAPHSGSMIIDVTQTVLEKNVNKQFVNVTQKGKNFILKLNQSGGIGLLNDNEMITVT